MNQNDVELKYEGWVIIHPEGRVETAYFNVRDFKTKLDGYKKAVTPEFWRKTYRPDCTMVKMKLVPLSRIDNSSELVEALEIIRKSNIFLKDWLRGRVHPGVSRLIDDGEQALAKSTKRSE